MDKPWRDEERLRRKYVGEEMTTREIADLWGCGKRTISRWMERHGIEPRPAVNPPKDQRLTDPEWLRQKYVRDGLSTLKIADEVGCNDETVRKYLHRHDIPVRDTRPSPSEPDTEERFWEKVDKGGPDECWEWTAGKHHGYGGFWDSVGGRNRRAHRYSWELHEGEIPEGECVLHDCDNRACVNPDHLHLGDRAQNQQEMVERGRVSRGEERYNATLTQSEVMEIRERYAETDMEQAELAEEYGITHQNVSNIVRGKTWKHVGGPVVE